MSTSIHIGHADQRAVERAAQSFVREAAFVAPPEDGWATLYDASADAPDLGELHRLAGSISGGLGCRVWGFLLAEGKVLVYLLYDQGELKDEYCSQPDFFGAVSEAREARLRGNPQVVMNYVRPGVRPDELARVLGGGFTQQMKDQLKATVGAADPEMVKKTLEFALANMSKLPPGALEGMLRQSGMPVDNPMLAPFLKDPEAAIRQLVDNPMALNLMTAQFKAMASGPLDSIPEPESMPPQTRLLELASLIGLNARRVLLTYGSLKDGKGEAAGFTKVG